MKKVQEQLTSTLGFSASASTSLLIGARSYFITGMLLDFEWVLNTGASTTSANMPQDFPFRSITSLRLQGGGRPYIAVGTPDLRSLYWHQRCRANGRFGLPAMPNTASTAGMVTKYTLPILFSVNPVKVNDDLDWFSTTAAIIPDSDLTLTITWSAAGSTTVTTQWGANYQIDTTTLLRVTLIGYVPASSAEEPKFYPVWQTQQVSPTATASGLGLSQDLTPGFFYRRSTVVLVNGSTTGAADRRIDSLSSASAVSEVGVKAADGRIPFNLRSWSAAMRSQHSFYAADDNTQLSQTGSQAATAAYGVPSVSAKYNPGVYMVDWGAIADAADGADPLYGIDMVNKSVGAVKMLWTVDASTNTTINMFHEALSRY